MKNKREYSFDIIRTIAVFCILLCHFNARYSFIYYGEDLREYMLLSQYPFKLFLGDLGVSLFFIISGASLYYNYRDSLDIKTFYRKRFLKLYPMFWIAYLTIFAIRAKDMLSSGIPVCNLIFTVIGMDGYLNGVIPTFYLIGEWFLGCIILIYLIFPLLRSLYKRNRYILWAVVLILYFFFSLKDTIPGLNKSSIIFVRIPEVLFGMEYAGYIRKKESDQDSLPRWVSHLLAILSASVLIFSSVADIEWNNGIQTTLVGISLFITVTYLWNVLKRSKFIQKRPLMVTEKICAQVSKYSYAIFLVHHIVISIVCDRIDMLGLSTVKRAGLFVILQIFIFACARLLYFVTDLVTDLLHAQ